MSSRPRLNSLLGVLMAAAMLLYPLSPAFALPAWFPHRTPLQGESSKSGRQRSIRLQEVAPPGAVQQLRRALDRRKPTLHLITPSNGKVLQSNQVDLRLSIEDWPLHEDPKLGPGPHVALKVDDREPMTFFAANDGELQITIDDLSPGSHRFSAWAAYPWGEAVKAPGASITWRLHLWQTLSGTQPDAQAPWLVPVHPINGPTPQPLLLDWLIWNAPLQKLRDDDVRWKLRLSVNGSSILVDQQEALWLKGMPIDDDLTLQMELLDGLGEAITPVFNNTLMRLQPWPNKKPAWMQEHLNEDELAILSGEPLLELDDETNPNQTTAEVIDVDSEPIAEEEPDDGLNQQEKSRQSSTQDSEVSTAPQRPTETPSNLSSELAQDPLIDESNEPSIDLQTDLSNELEPIPAPKGKEEDVDQIGDLDLDSEAAIAPNRTPELASEPETPSDVQSGDERAAEEDETDEPRQLPEETPLLPNTTLKGTDDGSLSSNGKLQQSTAISAS